MAEYQVSDEAIRFIVVWLVAAIFIHLAAKGIIGHSSFLTALLIAFLGSLAAALVAGLVGGVLGLVLAFATWALICALFYRARWLQGLAIGLVAWLLFILIRLLFDYILNASSA